MGVNAETGALPGPLKILQENGETWNNYLLLTPGVHMRECFKRSLSKVSCTSEAQQALF